jgi:hypothetical protein
MTAIPDDRALVRSDAARRGWLTRRKAEAMRGNVNAAKHYAYARLAIEGAVADRVNYLLEIAPYLDPLADCPALAAAARLSIRAERAFAAIDAAERDGREPNESLRKFAIWAEQAALRALAACSLTPTTRAALGLNKLDAAERARRLAEKALDAYRPEGQS